MKDKIKELEDILKYFDINGIECYYSEFSKEQTKTLIEFCKKNNLLMSGGSDFHGTKRPQIQIGVGKRNLKIPYFTWL